MAKTLKKDLRPPMLKWSDDSASGKTKGRRQHLFVTFVQQAFEKGGLLETKNVPNTHTWVFEVGGLMVTVKVLKVQTYICEVLRELNLSYVIKTQIAYRNLSSNDLRYSDISLTDDLMVVDNCLIY